MASLTRGLSKLLLEEWGGPRSVMALEYIREKIIPDLVNCFVRNSDLWQNSTFEEIISWKLKTQYAYPAAVVAGLSADMLKVVQAIAHPPALQQHDPKEPWRRIFRLSVCDQSLPGITEKTGYPLAYLDLLFVRFRRIRGFVSGNGRGLVECLKNPELREFGFEQLSFLYQFQRGFSSEPLFRERLVLEQVILDMGLPLEVPDLINLLEIVHTHEGCIDERTIASVFEEVGYRPNERNLSGLPGEGLEGVVERLTALYFLQKNKSGQLTLTPKSAATIAPFLAPRVMEQLRIAERAGDLEREKEILLKLNPEVLVPVLDAVVRDFCPHRAFAVLETIFKQVNRRIDLYLLSVLGRYQEGFALLMTCLEDQDSSLRAKACEALGRSGHKEGAFRLVQMLSDSVAGVRAEAVQALGELGSAVGIKALSLIAEDYGESSSLRALAWEALHRIEKKVDIRTEKRLRKATPS